MEREIVQEKFYNTIKAFKVSQNVVLEKTGVHRLGYSPKAVGLSPVSNVRFHANSFLNKYVFDRDVSRMRDNLRSVS